MNLILFDKVQKGLSSSFPPDLAVFAGGISKIITIKAVNFIVFKPYLSQGKRDKFRHTPLKPKSGLNTPQLNVTSTPKLGDPHASDPPHAALLSLFSSAVRGYFWPISSSATGTAANLSKGILFSGCVSSAICVVLSLMAILATQTAFSRLDPTNRLELSQDGFYAMGGWSFLIYDLVHIYVIGVFAFWLVRSLCWEAWIGGSALIIASLASFASLSVNIFLQNPALSALVHGESIGLPQPEAGYDVICSTLDFTQASFAMVGSFFLAGAALKAPKGARLVGWFVLVGVVISVFQIAEVGLHTLWTQFVNDWLTPVSQILEHLAIAIFLWILFRQKDISSDFRK